VNLTLHMSLGIVNVHCLLRRDEKTDL